MVRTTTIGIIRAASRLKEYQSDAVWDMVNEKFQTEPMSPYNADHNDTFWIDRAAYFEELVHRLRKQQ